MPDCTDQLTDIKSESATHNAVDKDWTGVLLSECLLGRPDRFLFISMWACLWGDFVKICAKKEKEEEERILASIQAALRSGQFEKLARAYKQWKSWAPHVTMICKEIESI